MILGRTNEPQTCEIEAKQWEENGKQTSGHQGITLTRDKLLNRIESK